MWNGLFCAIKPMYACMGIGTLVYKEAIKIMTNLIPPPARNGGNKMASLNRFLPTSLDADVLESTKSYLAKKASPPKPCSKVISPIFCAISHCDRSANFHKANGLKYISGIPFYDASIPQFNVHILGFDPLFSGELLHLRELFNDSTTKG